MLLRHSQCVGWLIKTEFCCLKRKDFIFPYSLRGYSLPWWRRHGGESRGSWSHHACGQEEESGQKVGVGYKPSMLVSYDLLPPARLCLLKVP